MSLARILAAEPAGNHEEIMDRQENDPGQRWIRACPRLSHQVRDLAGPPIFPFPTTAYFADHGDDIRGLRSLADALVWPPPESGLPGDSEWVGERSPDGGLISSSQHAAAKDLLPAVASTGQRLNRLLLRQLPNLHR